MFMYLIVPLLPEHTCASDGVVIELINTKFEWNNHVILLQIEDNKCR